MDEATALTLAAVERFWKSGIRQAVLISSPPGLGKTALLSAVADSRSEASGGTVAWVSGSVIASEGQFAAVLGEALEIPAPLEPEGRDRVQAIFCEVRARGGERFVVILDDLDQLVFKREGLLAALSVEFEESDNVLLIATAKPMSVPRLTAGGRAFGGRLRVLQLGLLDRPAGIELIRLRAPHVPSDLANEIYHQAGGHQGALVFLARLATLSQTPVAAGQRLDPVWDRAAEFAGAVYAQQWYSLGPQQRAILWELATRDGSESSPTELSDALFLAPSHVGAQLKRLENEALVERVSQRGRYRIAPLLARWITERAVRKSTS